MFDKSQLGTLPTWMKSSGAKPPYRLKKGNTGGGDTAQELC